MLYSDRVPYFKDTIKAVFGKDFQFSELMKNGHIELDKGAVVTENVKEGVMFSNMLDIRQPSNALQGRVVDNISGNYNYKLGVARVMKIGESKYKKEFRSMSFAPRNIV